MKKKYIKPSSTAVHLMTESLMLSVSSQEPGRKDEIGGDQLSNRQDFEWGKSEWDETDDGE